MRTAGNHKRWAEREYSQPTILSPAGLEPAIFGLEVRRLVHHTNGAQNGCTKLIKKSVEKGHLTNLLGPYGGNVPPETIAGIAPKNSQYDF